MISISDNYFKIHLHYILSEDDMHQMDANVHNECERQFLLALDVLKQDYIGDFIVDVRVPQNGGFIDELVIPNLPGFLSPLLGSLLSSVIELFFSNRPSRLENIKNRFDILEKIKSGKYSEEEVRYLVQSDRKLKRIVNKFYEAAKNELTIERIEASLYTEDRLISKERIVREGFPIKLPIKVNIVQLPEETFRFNINDKRTPQRQIAAKLIQDFVSINRKMNAMQIIKIWSPLSSVPHFIISDEEFAMRTDVHKFERSKCINCGDGSAVWVTLDGWVKEAVVNLLLEVERHIPQFITLR